MTSPIETQLYIGGIARSASGGKTFDIFNPARPSELIGKAADASIGDAEAAIEAARQAFPAWSALSYHERGAYLTKISEILGDEADIKYRAELFTREHGKTLKETNIEIGRLGTRFAHTATFADRLAQEETLDGPMFKTRVTHQARGVSTLIVPWNWPLAILASKLPHALMAGNTVVVKLSEFSCLAPALSVIKIAAALPPGVVNLVTGDGLVIGDTLTGSPYVRQVNFTGSVRVGRHIMQTAAKNITPVTLELGGNDAGLILEDVDTSGDFFVRLYLAGFLTTGQICMAMKRCYVHRSRFEEVVEGLSAILDKQVIGDGMLPETTMGPMNNARQHRVIELMREEAKATGADLRNFGQVPDQALFDQGHFHRPALIVGADPALSAVKDEQFGPLLPIIPFDSEEQAVAMANDSDYGLSSSVWTADKDRAEAIARRLEAGFTNINAHGPTAMDGTSPFGGVKLSGLGRNFGFDGVRQFQETHSIAQVG